MIRRILGEPFVHFLLLGLFLTGVSLFSGGERTIRISEAEQERLAAIWTAEAGNMPTDRDMQGLIAAQVEEEALYREALNLGLDDGDTIVRRRLAQKMRFMLGGLAEAELPAEAELEDWYRANAERFTDPATVSFQHIFISADDGQREDGEAVRRVLDATRDGADWRTLGDPFMLQRSYANIDRPRLAALFGDEFAENMFTLPEGEWRGPVSSALGLHVVQVTERAEGVLRSFDEARPAVEAEWLDEAERREDQAAVQKIVDLYDVEID